MSLFIEGYASRFGECDLNDDVVVPGAFAASLLRSTADGVRMLYQHQAKSPVGVWDEIFEDRVGLFVRGRIEDVGPEARMVAAMVRTGVIDGLSIGFRTVKSRRSDGGRLRVLSEVELWEVSLVTFPMLRTARIVRVSEGALAA